MNTSIFVANPENEPASPFLPRPEPVDLAALADSARTESSLFVELVADARKIVLRFSERAELERVVTGALGAMVLGVLSFSFLLFSGHGFLSVARTATLLVVNLLGGLAAALGPIYAVSVLLTARMRLAHLVAVLLAGAGAGGLFLGVMAPLCHLAGRFDPEWAGPLSVVGSFFVASLVTGLRIHSLLVELAELVRSGPLGAAARFRLGILARMAFVLVALHSALALWAFDALMPG